MNTRQRKVVLVAVIVAGGSLARYLSYSESMRLIHTGWLFFAVLAVVVGISAFVWAGRE